MLHKKNEMSVMDMLLWIGGELVVISLTLTLIASLINALRELD